MDNPKDEYIDLTLIECNRLSGFHPKDTNAVWTNNLANTFHMKEGDRVSMYGSFISERGSGQVGSIELKGDSLGKTKKIKTTVVSEVTNYKYTTREVEYLGEAINYIEEDVEMFDNKCSMVINFYKTMDLMNYIQLPRRFYKNPRAGPTGIPDWTSDDSIPAGRTHVELSTIGAGSDLFTGFNIIKEDHTVQSHKSNFTNIKWFLKNDNTTYTIMGREHVPFIYNDGSYTNVAFESNASYTNPDIVRVVNDYNALYYPRVGDTIGDVNTSIVEIISITSEYRELLTKPPTSGDLTVFKGEVLQSTNPNNYPKYYVRDPENANYHIIRDKIDIDIPQGFSSASILSNKITRQLRETTDIDTEFVQGQFDTTGTIKNQIPITKTLESNTYKTFNATNTYYSSKDNYDETFLNAKTTANGLLPITDEGLPAIFKYTETLNQKLTDFYRGYQYIAIKRPEIYETGCKINDILGLQIINGLETFSLIVAVSTFPTDPDITILNHTYADNLVQIGWFVNNGTKNIKITDIKYIPNTGSGLNLIKFTLEEEWGARSLATSTVVFSSTYTGNLITTTNRKTEPIVTSLEYNEANCLLLKNFFESTEKYELLYSNENVDRLHYPATDNEYLQGDTATNGSPAININNSRFLHMNTHPNTFMTNGRSDDSDLTVQNYSDNIDTPYSFVYKSYDASQLGNGYYDTVGLVGTVQTVPASPITTPIALATTKVREVTDRAGSRPIFFHFDPKQKNTFYPNPKLTSNEYTYGCLGTSGKYITIYPNKIIKDDGNPVGIPSWFFAGTDTTSMQPRRKIGFDRHFNAWSTCAIQLANGSPSTGYIEQNGFGGRLDPHEQSSPFIFDLGTSTSFNQAQHINQVYLGATSPTIGFDGVHFFFEDLHTPLSKGFFEPRVIDVSNDSSTIVYKMNPQQTFNNYTPTQFPYEKSKTWDTNGNEDGGQVEIVPLNPNVEPYAIYDTSTGIFIEDFGYTEDKWINGLWGSLGFTYDQISGGKNLIRNDRVDFRNQDSLSLVTTNCNIDSIDTKSWAMWPTGSAIFDGSVVNNYNVSYKALHPPEGVPAELVARFTPEIVVPASSIRINAKEFPVSMDVAYYTIRSDIVPNTAFLGGRAANTAMPIVAVVDKMNPQGDFYFGTESSLEFMITKPTIISSISVSIHDPDGKYANASKRSSVIFKIKRLRKLTFNIQEEIQEKLKEKKKKK